jgi:hypothetical protein
MAPRGTASVPRAQPIGAVLSELAKAGRLPRRPAASEEPTAGADGLAQLPPVAQNDEDFGIADPQD